MLLQTIHRLAPTLSLSFLFAQAIFKPNPFPNKYSNILKPTHSSYLSAYEDGIECSETSAYKIQRPVIIQKKAYNIQNTAKVWNQEVVRYINHMRKVEALD